MKRLAVAFLSAALLAVAVSTGCTSQQSAQPAPPPQPPELLTGRAAFQQLFVAARGWAADVRPYQLQSQSVGDNNGRDGKAVVWNAAFASAARGARPYTWSGMDSPDGSSQRGISHGSEDSYAPSDAFEIAFLKVDSDKAYDVAQKHGGDKVLADAPSTPVIYLLDWNIGGNALVWHVIYGNSRNDAKLTVDVDASTGLYIRTEK